MTCEGCGHYKELFGLYGYEFRSLKEYICVLGKERKDAETCEKRLEQEEKKADLLSDLQRAENDVRALLKFLKK